VRRETAGYLPLEAAARRVQVPVRSVRQFIRIGLVSPSRVEGRDYLFGEVELARLRKIRRLREDLGLDMAALEIVLRLLDEIETLNAQLDAGTGRRIRRR
jgi:MerR family transcriptional regulator, heat shock protein HspR